jgi:hypothetical protein
MSPISTSADCRGPRNRAVTGLRLHEVWHRPVPAERARTRPNIGPSGAPSGSSTARTIAAHLPATITTHALRRTLKTAATWPFADAFILCWQRLTALPDPT